MPAHQRKAHGRMDRTTQSLIIVLAKILTGNDRAAGADADAKANAELGEHHRGLNATQRELTAKLTDDISTDKRVGLLKNELKKMGTQSESSCCQITPCVTSIAVDFLATRPPQKRTSTDKTAI